MNHKKIDFSNISRICFEFSTLIDQKREDITNILINYESRSVIEDEIKRSIKCLKNIKTEKEYFDLNRISKISTFFPLNLPLYSTILFAITPSFFAEIVYLRPPVLMRSILKDIFKLLDIESTFSIKLCEVERSIFVNEFVKNSDIIIFTGQYKNALDLLPKIQDKAMLIYNGAGVNPVIVTESANISLAVKKVKEVKLFNSGQDCAGPDIIFVNEKVEDDFLELLKISLSSVGIGEYLTDNEVGPLIDSKHLLYIEKILQSYKEDIVFGGRIDFDCGIVYPTIIKTKVNQKINYSEFFAPIFFMCTYKSEEDLLRYFADNKYRDYTMYVSVFGDFKLYECLGNSIILNEKNILDFEDGNKEFGGYGNKASFVYKNNKMISSPILVSREINKYLKDL